MQQRDGRCYEKEKPRRGSAERANTIQKKAVIRTVALWSRKRETEKQKYQTKKQHNQQTTGKSSLQDY